MDDHKKSYLIESAVDDTTKWDNNFKPKGKLSLSSFRKIINPSDQQFLSIIQRLQTSNTKNYISELKQYYNWNKKTDKNKRMVFILWLDNNNLVAYADIEVYNDGVNFLTPMVITEPYKGYGLSSQILSYIISKYNVNELGVRINNRVAIELYKKHGFKVSNKYDGKSSNKDNLLYMVREQSDMRSDTYTTLYMIKELGNISEASTSNIINIDFPEEEIDTLKKQNKIITTRVSAEYNKYHVGDLIRTPWGDVFRVVDIKKFKDVKNHPYLDELTQDQIKLLNKYKKMNLVTSYKQKDVKESNVFEAKYYTWLPNPEFNITIPKNIYRRIIALLERTPKDRIFISTDWHMYKEKYSGGVGLYNEYLKWCRENLKYDDVFIYLGDVGYKKLTYKEQAEIQQLMKSIKCHKILIVGNHDIMMGDDAFIYKCGFDYVMEELEWNNLIFTHIPIKPPVGYLNIHGHIHDEEGYINDEGKYNLNAYPSFYGNKPVSLEYLLNNKDKLVKTHFKNPVDNIGSNWTTEEIQAELRSIKREQSGISEDSKIDESWIFSDRDVYYNYAKFKYGYINKLLIVGFSGSGKSTLSRSIKERYPNYEYINLDDIINPPEISSDTFNNLPDISKKFINNYILKRNNITTIKDFKDKLNEKSKQESDRINKNIIIAFISELDKESKYNTKIKYIIDGIWPLFFNMSPDGFKDWAVIIKGTSFIKSAIRDSSKEDNGFFKRLSYLFKYITDSDFKEYGQNINTALTRWQNYFNNLNKLKQQERNNKQNNSVNEEYMDEACKDVATARQFVTDVDKLAKKYDANYFIVTDGASGVRNNGNPAVRNARLAQIEWEKNNNGDPDEDWSDKVKNGKYNEGWRADLPDSSFGIPEDRKFPLDNEKRVKSAIHLFGHAPEDKKKSLARKISRAANKYGIKIPETTQVYKYLHGSTNESGVAAMASVNPIVGGGGNYILRVQEPGDLFSKLVYSRDPSSGKGMVVNRNNKLEIINVNENDIVDKFKFVGNEAYIDRLINLYNSNESVESLYNILTGSHLYMEEQIDFDSNFKLVNEDFDIERHLTKLATFKEEANTALGNHIYSIDSLSEMPIELNDLHESFTDVVVKEDMDGYYLYDGLSHRRTRSVSEVNLINKNMFNSLLTE